jgi:chaperonin cofactor prefoldin
MLKVNKSEIDQLKEQAERYEKFMAIFNPQIEEFQREISNLKNQINEEAEKKKNRKSNNAKR